MREEIPIEMYCVKPRKVRSAVQQVPAEMDFVGMAVPPWRCFTIMYCIYGRREGEGVPNVHYYRHVLWCFVPIYVKQ